MRWQPPLAMAAIGAFALSPLRGLWAQWIFPAPLPAEFPTTVCAAPRERLAVSLLPVALQEDGAMPSQVSLLLARDAPEPWDRDEAPADITRLPRLILSAPARVAAGAPLDFSASWSAPSEPVTIAHPFHAGGKTQVVYTLFVRDESTHRTYELDDHTPMMCGTRNALGEADFLALGAHERRAITPLTDTGADLTKTSLVAPLRYTLWLGYAFCGTGAGSTFHTRDRQLPPHTFSGELTSNAVVVEVY